MSTNHPLADKIPTLSACLIVKNEEKSLGTCLQSIRDYVDEIIVVDTGSSDRTVGIADKFGAKIYQHPWENHFSKHRNQSLKYAKGDWLFIIDADEELQAGNGSMLRQAIQIDDDVDAIAVILECAFGGHAARSLNNSLRILRNHRGVHYQGRVHNYLVGVKKAVCSSIRIFHHGYVADHETRLRRFQRTTALLKLDIAENPQNPRPHHFLAASYLSENLHQEAATEAEKALNLYESSQLSDPNYLWTAYIAASAYLDLGQLEKAEHIACKSLQVRPDHLDAHYLLALIAYQKKDHASFLNHLEHFLQILDRIEKDPSRFGEMVHNSFSCRWRLHLFNAFLYLHLNRYPEFQNELSKGLAFSPEPFLYYQQLGNMHLLNKNFAQAEQPLLQALECNPHAVEILWALSYVYEKTDRPYEQSTWLEQLIKLDPRFPQARFQLGLAYMRQNSFLKAFESFQEALALNPHDRLARINQALCLRAMGKYEESIQVALTVQAERDTERITLKANLGYCYDALGRFDQAVLHFRHWSELQPSALEPLIYLSKLLLESRKIEACAVECAKLLNLMGLKSNREMNNLLVLGNLFDLIGRRLAGLKRESLARLCFDISKNCIEKHAMPSSS